MASRMSNVREKERTDETPFEDRSQQRKVVGMQQSLYRLLTPLTGSSRTLNLMLYPISTCR
jgi:hypothetical protein